MADKYAWSGSKEIEDYSGENLVRLMRTMRNILVIYRCRQYPLRATIREHLYSFQRHSDARCFYLNVSVRKVPRWLQGIPFDLIVFHTTFLSTRWSLKAFAKLIEKARELKEIAAVKIALPQDEFIHTDILCNFINEFGIDYVFSVSPESEWPKIYKTVDFNKVKFFNVLTGYLDDATVAKINALAKSVPNRPVDIGYRAWRAAPWLGRHGYLKAQIDNVFQREAPKWGLITDISTRPEDTFLGDDWYRFLLRCKYTIGIEGGASILDRDGSIKKKTEDYLVQHPEASFEEVEAACFPNLDGSLGLFAISPRHLEACATRTCQVLVEGDYNGALVAGKHYIELKRDLSNINQVLDIIKQDELRSEITERAYRDIVESERYTYKRFVEFIIGESLRHLVLKSSSSQKPIWSQLVYYYAQLVDTLSWIEVVLFRYLIIPLYHTLSDILPERLKAVLRRIRQAKVETL